MKALNIRFGIFSNLFALWLYLFCLSVASAFVYASLRFQGYPDSVAYIVTAFVAAIGVFLPYSMIKDDSPLSFRLLVSFIFVIIVPVILNVVISFLPSYTRVPNYLVTRTATPTIVADVPTITPGISDPSVTVLPGGTPTATVSPSLDLTTAIVSLNPRTIRASGVAPPGVDAAGNPVTYEPFNVLDGRFETAWRVQGDGEEAFLAFRFPSPVCIAQVGVVPGYAKTDSYDGTDRFLQNRRVEQAWLQLADGISFPLVFADIPEMQYKVISPTHSVSATLLVERTILPSIVDERNYTAISEVSFEGFSDACPSVFVYRAVEPYDGFVVVRAETTMASAEVARLASGTQVACERFVRGQFLEGGDLWAYCPDAGGYIFAPLLKPVGGIFPD